MKALVKACMSMSVPLTTTQRAVATMVSAYTYRKLSRIGLDQSQYIRREWNRIEEERRGPLLKLHGDQQHISRNVTQYAIFISPTHVTIGTAATLTLQVSMAPEGYLRPISFVHIFLKLLNPAWHVYI